MSVAIFAVPKMVALFRFIENFPALGTVTAAFRTDCVQRMTRSALGTVPKMMARLADRVSPLTIFIRTIPLIAANNIRCMMRLIRFAIPEMCAVFRFVEDLLAF